MNSRRHVFRKRQAEHVDRTGEARFPKLRPFFHTGYRRRAVSFFQSDAERLHRAVAVGIGLHNRQHIDFLREMLPDDPHIMSERVQIDPDLRNRHDSSSCFV